MPQIPRRRAARRKRPTISSPRGTRSTISTSRSARFRRSSNSFWWTVSCQKLKKRKAIAPHQPAQDRLGGFCLTGGPGRGKMLKTLIGCENFISRGTGRVPSAEPDREGRPPTASRPTGSDGKVRPGARGMQMPSGLAPLPAFLSEKQEWNRGRVSPLDPVWVEGLFLCPGSERFQPSGGSIAYCDVL